MIRRPQLDTPSFVLADQIFLKDEMTTANQHDPMNIILRRIFEMLHE